MKNILTLSILALFCFISATTNAQSSSQSSELVTKNFFDGQKITAININNMCQATVKQGSKNSVKITCNKYLENDLVVELNNGELYISQKGNKNRNNLEQKRFTLHAEITCSDLTSIKCNGMSKTELLGDKFNTTDLAITINGMSNFRGTKINNNGSATIIANGMSEITVAIAATQNIKVTANGMSKVSATIEADGSVDALASGMSSLTLTGQARLLNVRSNGMSNVETKNFNSAKTNVSTKQ